MLLKGLEPMMPRSEGGRLDHGRPPLSKATVTETKKL